MNIWIDADACPTQIRDIVLRGAHRRAISVVFVANKLIELPKSDLVTFVQVLALPDAADNYIAEKATKGDLVVTQDIPLAAILVPMGITVISPRGDSFNEDNIGDLAARRELMQGLRDTGEITGGPRPFDDRLKRAFANLFDAALQRLSKH